MFNSKKGDMNIGLILFIFMIMSIVILIGIIFNYLLFVVGHDYAVLTLYEAGVESNQSAQIQEGFENTVEFYEAIDISGTSDNIWLFSYLSMSIIGFTAAYKSRKTGIFSFLSMATYGILFMLYLFSLFLIIMNWLYFDVLLNLFTNLIPNLPMLEFWVTNGGLLFLIQASLLLLVKVIDLDFSSSRAREKKEEAAFDDEVL